MKIKFTHLSLLLLITLVGISYASIYDNWPDEAICNWLEQKPNHEGYLAEDKKRGLNCSNDPNYISGVASIDSVNLVSNPYAGLYDDWPDKVICMWLELRPDHVGYLAEDKKRGLNCFEDPNFNPRFENIEVEDNDNQAVTY